MDYNEAKRKLNFFIKFAFSDDVIAIFIAPTDREKYENFLDEWYDQERPASLISNFKKERDKLETNIKNGADVDVYVFTPFSYEYFIDGKTIQVRVDDLIRRY